MTAATVRLARIVGVRDRQKRIARAHLAKAEAELTAIQITSIRVAAFRHDFAPQVAGTKGHEMRAAGEFGARLDGLESILVAKQNSASESKALAEAASLAAWRNHHAISSLHSRATADETKRVENRLSSERPHRAVRKRGDAR